MEYKIRRATILDAELLSELGGSTFYDTFAQFHNEHDMQLYIQKAYDSEIIRANLMNPEIAYFIAFCGDEAAGYTKLILNASHELLHEKSIEMEKIYVRKQYLDKKTGAALMDHALTYGADSGYKTMFLGVWQENHRAVHFYKRYGFETFATRNFQLGQRLCDDFVMKRELKKP